MTFIIYTLLLIALYMLAHNLLITGILKVLAWFRGHEPEFDDKIEKVSVIIPVFNEQNQIVDKIMDTLKALKGCDCGYEVLIGSDGSEDLTVDITRKYIEENNLQGFRLLAFANEGKGKTLNKLVEAATGDIIVSTDADTRIHEDAVKKTVHAFRKDKDLGCLSCVPVFTSKKMGLQAAYWDYELKLRAAESRLGQLVVVTGWLYAYRKQVFRPIPATAMADDLWVPLSILLDGFRCVQHTGVECFSEATDESTEVKRRKRVISGGADIVKRLLPRLKAKPLLFFIVFSHKINRWLLPFWAGLFFVTSLMINPLFLLLYAGLFFYLLISLGPRRFFYLAYSVVTPLFSIIKNFKTSDLSKWTATRIKDENKK
jgi:cellulose synthase/poly-beta-1,6-N-acetylglucosamine synthase-like glycosyltransferase